METDSHEWTESSRTLLKPVGLNAMGGVNSVKENAPNVLVEDKTHLTFDQTKKEVASMNNDIAKGKVKQVKGNGKEAVGKLTGNRSQEIRGKVEYAAGKVQEQYGRAKKDIKKASMLEMLF